MSLSFYFDHHMHAAIVAALRGRGIDCLTAAADGADRLRDEQLLERATHLGRVLVSNDEDHLVIASAWMLAGRDFSGVVYCRQDQLSIGDAVEDLQIIATVLSPSDMLNRIEYIPL
jgi:predicted nuclease of predicted toxin-antitoxin system